MPLKYFKYFFLNYFYLFIEEFNFKIKDKYRYDLESFRMFLNDYMYGFFLGGINTDIVIDGAAYTLNLSKYLGIKEVNKKAKVITNK